MVTCIEVFTTLLGITNIQINATYHVLQFHYMITHSRLLDPSGRDHEEIKAWYQRRKYEILMRWRRHLSYYQAYGVALGEDQIQKYIYDHALNYVFWVTSNVQWSNTYFYRIFCRNDVFRYEVYRFSVASNSKMFLTKEHGVLTIYLCGIAYSCA